MRKLLFVFFCLSLMSLDFNISKKIKQQKKLKEYIEKEQVEQNDLKRFKNIPKNKFLFIEIMNVESAKTVNCNKDSVSLPLRFIDFPMYNFDKENQKLTYYDSKFTLNTGCHFNTVLGMGRWLHEGRGSGGCTDLYTSCGLPLYEGEAVIYSVDSVGNAYLRYKNIYYKVGINETVKDSLYIETKLKKCTKGHLEIKIVTYIRNHGFLDNDAFISPKRN